MKKLHLIVQKKDVVFSLEELRALGIVHVEHQRDLVGASLMALREDVNLIEQSLNILKPIKNECAQNSFDDWRVAAEKIVAINAERLELKEIMAKRRVLISHWTPWGEFELADIEALAAKDLIVRLCEIPVTEECTHLEGVIVETIFHAGGVARNVVISHEEVDLPFETVPLPTEGLKSMREHQVEDQKRLESLEKEIKDSVCYRQAFENALGEQQEVLHFEEVSFGLREEGELSLLKGFSPVDTIKQLEDSAQKHQWGLVIEEPTDEDQVPTLLRNPKWIKIIDPVLKMINIVPGFKEFDVSFLFLIFFTLFFGMLIGDAGYGLVFLFLTSFAQFKMGAKMSDKGPFILMYVLSGVTILYGGLTATFFGQKWLSASISPAVPWLT
ncbi:hypothetical protein ACFL49_03530, partial [Candidatus Omnitrophota bacterium]